MIALLLFASETQAYFNIIQFSQWSGLDFVDLVWHYNHVHIKHRCLQITVNDLSWYVLTQVKLILPNKIQQTSNHELSFCFVEATGVTSLNLLRDIVGETG